MHAALLMVKNESVNIRITLPSLVGKVQSLILFDTGSTDDTLEYARDFCLKNNMACHIREGTFIDFATSRNQALDFADTVADVDYLVLLDARDVLEKYVPAENHAAAYVTMKLGSVALQMVRLVKNRAGFRYVGVVHEVLKVLGGIGSSETVISQDRTGQVGPRLPRDYALLTADYLAHPNDSRTVFYLAQTCFEMKKYAEAFKYSLIRVELGGFQEEVYGSYMRMGHCNIHRPEHWFLKAYGVLKRAEPLEALANLHPDPNIKALFIDEMCRLDPPKALLAVDHDLYERRRWELKRRYGTTAPAPALRESRQT